MIRKIAAAAILAAIAQSASAADLVRTAPSEPSAVYVERQAVQYPVFKGVVAVMDGRTLWYPRFARKVRLAGIDTCELPQWALDPKWTDREKQKYPYPVPCGPFAKAWLKRTIANQTTECTTLAFGADGVPEARCTVKGREIAVEMLRVGWARVSSPYANSQYLAYQKHAMAARYGMWETYVLDMNEWRRKAVDKTLQRRPLADFNLLAERESEISPPFIDAWHKPKRTDR